MSFGFAIGDFIILLQLASRVVRDSRKACGAHDELTHEVSSLHTVLQRLKKETEKPESPLNRPSDSCQDELQSILAGCKKLLKTLETILVKYDSLSQGERSGRKLWQRIRFGNGEMQDLTDLRAKLVYYTSALSLFLNMISIGSVGRVEKRMEEAGGDLREIKLAVNGITAHLLAGSKREGSVLTAYADDDKAVWKEFRRELVSEGFSSATIHKHKDLIKAYVRELASRGLLDERDTYGGDDEAIHNSSNAGEDPFQTPSYGTVQADGVGGECSTSSPNKYSCHKSSSDSEASLYDPDYPSKTEIDLAPYTPRFQGDHFWQLGNTPILRPRRRESCKVSRAGQTIEDVPRPILTSPVRNESIRCVRCLSDILTVTTVVLRCGHRMCLVCLRRLFGLSIIEPRNLPPRCCTENLTACKYVDKIFNERVKMQWEQECERYPERLKYLYDVDEQLPLEMLQHAVVSSYLGTVAEVYKPVFIVGPYGTCLLALGWNVSLLLCSFRHWFGIIQKCLSEPRISRLQQESLETPDDVLYGIETLRLLKLDGLQIAKMEKVGASDAVDPVLVHLNALNILRMLLSIATEFSFRGIVERIERWLLKSQRECPEILFGVQQWICTIERTEAKWGPEDIVNCTPGYMSGTGKGYLRNTSYQSAPTDSDLERDLTWSSAPTESQTFDDSKHLVLASIAMARAIWKRDDRLSWCYSEMENLSRRLSYYQDEMEPRCVNYLVGPPSDAKTREQGFKVLHEWVETDFLEIAEPLEMYDELHNDQPLIYTAIRRFSEARRLLRRLKGGMSSAEKRTE